MLVYYYNILYNYNILYYHNILVPGRSELVLCLFLFYPDIVSHLGFLNMMQIPEPINFVKVGYRVMCNKLTYLQHSNIEENMKKSVFSFI